MRLISAGAAQTVTGSCHLLELSGKKLLVDCGLFQGTEDEHRNEAPFPFDVHDIDAVLVTHGHLDHIGRLPLLVKRGYSGPIYTTAATREIAKVVLLDSAKLQQEDYEHALKAERHNDKEQPAEPLYDEDDVNRTLGAMSQAVTFDRRLELDGKIGVTFHPAGHILGSAYIECDCPDGRVVCSGDLGNRESGIQKDARPPRECDAVLIETTYADRNHRSLEATLAEFKETVAAALGRGGNVLIPSFALERSQNVLYQLKRMMDAGDIPQAAVYLDSPMATKMTHLYQDHVGELQDEVADSLRHGEDPFEPRTLEYTMSVGESRKINDIVGGAIIIAGSGMMTGGRILHHLKHNLWREEASLIVVGYQAKGTLGREIIDGADHVRVMGDNIPVRAGVHTIGGFSAHADQDDLLAWLAGTGDAHVYLVHGEKDTMDAFARVLSDKGRQARCVEMGEVYDLGAGKD